MEHAKVKLVESHRDDIFLQQAENWRQTKLLRDYVAAMTSAVADLEDVDERAAVKAWIDWCAESAEQNDPLAGPLRMPDDPEANPIRSNVLQGWSPYGRRPDEMAGSAEGMTVTSFGERLQDTSSIRSRCGQRLPRGCGGCSAPSEPIAMTALAQFGLFLSSYAPLFGVFALLDSFGAGWPTKVCIGLAILGIVLPLVMLIGVKRLAPQALRWSKLRSETVTLWHTSPRTSCHSPP